MSSDQSLTNRATALRRWALTPVEDRKRQGQLMNRGLLAKFEREAIAAGHTEPAEIQRAAESLLRAHMIRAAQKSAAKRRVRK